MRSLIAWIGLGVVCAALAFGLVGQKVLGQPEPPLSGAPGLPPSIQIAPTGQDLIPPPSFTPPVGIPTGAKQPAKTGDTDLMPPPGSPPPSTSYEPPPPFPTGGSDAKGPAKVTPSTANKPVQIIEPSAVPPAPPAPQTASAPEARTGKNQPSVTIEWIGPEVARLNQPMACQILVCNNGSVPVQQVTVRHCLPEGVEQRGSEPAAKVEERVLTWSIGNLEPGQTRRIDVMFVSKNRGPLHCHADVTFTGSSSLQVQVREPLLNVKVKGPDKVVVGDPATFQVVISNPGDGVTENATIKTTLPEGLEHSGGRVLALSAGNLAPKETKTLQLVCKTRGAGGVQQIVIHASADGDLKASDTVQLDVMQPKLDLVVTGPKLRYIDRHAVYSLKVTNPGSTPAGNVTLSEVVPAGFKFKAASNSGRYDEATQTVVWFLGDLMPGQHRETNLEFVAAAAGDHKLTAQATLTRGVKTEAEAQTRVEGLSSLLVEVSDVDDPVEVGVETAYEVRVTNVGTKAETNLQLVCTLPEHMEFRGARSEGDLRFQAVGRDLVFEPLTKLIPRAGIVFRIQVKGTQAGNHRFRVQVRSDSLAEPIVRDEVTRVYSDDAPLK